MTARCATVRAGLLLALFSLMLPGLALAQNDKDIRVEVVAGTDGYMIVFKDNECPPDWNEEAGCVYQRRGNSGRIRWRLDDTNLDKGWELEALYLGTAEKTRGVDDHGQSGCLKDDFGMTNSDLSTGEVSSAKVHSGGKFLDIRNENVCRNEYYVHYTLTAVQPATGERAESDPIISNGGRR